ncbi:MAG: RluA family pseudouridine synthase, partial [Kordiimonadaceae bacterium]|nr:RluA family pseudouridine synthase [Kordiimonadaceae bacterium]
MSGVQKIEVNAGDDGARLDRWFKRYFPHVGFGQLQKLMRKGDIRLDGKRVKGKEKVSAGQIVRVPPLDDAPTGPQKAPKMRLTDAMIEEVMSWVLYKDEDVIAINKPAGLPTQGGTGQVRHLDGMLDGLRFGGKFRPRLVHRL